MRKLLSITAVSLVCLGAGFVTGCTQEKEEPASTNSAPAVPLAKDPNVPDEKKKEVGAAVEKAQADASAYGAAMQEKYNKK